MDKMSMSHEDYLEAMVMLGASQTTGVRSVDVAEKLGVSKASVSKAVAGLREAGYLDQAHYGSITLTERGLERGPAVLERHGARHKRRLLQEVVRVRRETGVGLASGAFPGLSGRAMLIKLI